MTKNSLHFANNLAVSAQCKCKSKGNIYNMMILYSDYFPKKTIKRFKLLPSTHDFASKWCQSDLLPPEGSIVIAENQTHGKGQTGNSWQSEAGRNLTFSMIYYPTFLTLDRLFALNMITSLAVWESINHLDLTNLAIKWPNDILINHQKVAGILIRNSLSGKKLGCSIIGIGLNVHQLVFPQGIPNATSLQLATNRVVEKDDIFNRIIHHFEAYYISLKNGQYDTIKQRYLEQLYRKGQESTFFRKDGAPFQGKILDVRDTGHLLVDIEGDIEVFDFQEIQFTSSR